MARRAPDVGVIVGLGGGSAMDCAKGINFLFTNGGRMEDYWGDGKATAPMLPSIGVPTTAGTGSEAQRYALIARESDHQKMACGDEKARFRTVILDAQLLDTAPRGVVAAAAADALAHAVESFVCTRANPVSRLFAREAFRLLHRPMAAWVGAQASPDDGDDMLLGAHWAGAAIDSSMLGAAHACANPLTGRYGITHGVAVGMMLPHVIRFNGEATDAYAELAAMADSAGASGATAAESVALRVEELNGAAALPAGLRDLDVPSRDLSSLAEAAVGQKTAVFNPRPIGVAECLELYRAAY
jgi:alcohol dehydrogenase